MSTKPFAEACERNKGPLLKVLSQYLGSVVSVLEIGSGTGQHAVYFASQFPHLTWQTADLSEQHPGIQAWIADEGPSNVRPPLELDVNDKPWPLLTVDAVFSANIAHIIPWSSVENLFEGVGQVLCEGGWFLLYGPFNYGGQYTSESNASFDAWLKGQNFGGIRDVEDLRELAAATGMNLYADHSMPANNRTLVWRKFKV